MITTRWRRFNTWRDHRWSRPRYSDFIDGELPLRQQRRLAEHAEVCPECARLIATLEIMLEVLPSLRLPPSAALAVAEQTAERVRAQIEEWG